MRLLCRAGVAHFPGVSFHSISAPILRTVPEVKDFNNLVGVTIDDNVRGADKLAGSFYLSRATYGGESCQLFNAFDNSLSYILGSDWIVLLDVSDSGYKLVGRSGCPLNQPHV
jgi:hypothetical protein